MTPYPTHHRGLLKSSGDFFCLDIFLFLFFLNKKCRIQIYLNLRKSRTVSVIALKGCNLYACSKYQAFKQEGWQGISCLFCPFTVQMWREKYRHWIDIMSSQTASHTNLNDRTLAHSSLGPTFLGGWCGVVVTRILLVWSLHVAST